MNVKNEEMAYLSLPPEVDFIIRLIRLEPGRKIRAAQNFGKTKGKKK